jgi:hypothetical protein
MKPWIPYLFAALALAGCAAPPDSTEARLPAARAIGGYALASPIEFPGGALVPIMLARPIEAPQDVPISLREARELGVVEIAEQDEMAVGAVEVTNTGDRPILLLTGDLLVGGNQDRLVARDTLVPPGQTVEVPAMCVEEGRWEGESKEFDYAMAMVPNRVRRQALLGGQEGVWSSVSAFNALARANSEGTTVQQGLQAPTVRTYVDRQLPRLEKALAGVEGAVGYLLVSEGKIQSMDLFASPDLFDSSRLSLLKGALAEASTIRSRKNRISLADCEAFLLAAVEGDRSVENDDPDHQTVAVKGRNGVRGVELREAPGRSLEQTLIHGVYLPR